MSTASIHNTQGALQNVSDFRTLMTSDRELAVSGFEMDGSFRANAAITQGQVVMFVVATQTVPTSVTPMTTAADPRLFAGVALKAAAAGQQCPVRRQGIVDLYVNAQTVAFGDVALVPGTNAGEASCSATDPAAATIVGTVLGTVLAAKDAGTLRAPTFLQYV